MKFPYVPGFLYMCSLSHVPQCRDVSAASQILKLEEMTYTNMRQNWGRNWCLSCGHKQSPFPYLNYRNNAALDTFPLKTECCDFCEALNTEPSERSVPLVHNNNVWLVPQQAKHINSVCGPLASDSAVVFLIPGSPWFKKQEEYPQTPCFSSRGSSSSPAEVTGGTLKVEEDSPLHTEVQLRIMWELFNSVVV